MSGYAWPDARAGKWANWVCGENGNLLRSPVSNPLVFTQGERSATVEQSSFIRVGQYKSPLRVVAGILLRSRETQAERVLQKSEEIEWLRRYRADFARVSVKQMRTWVSENLGTTLASKRQTA